MATLTSHALNGLDGSHAGGIHVSLVKGGSPEPLRSSKTDDGGRLSFEFDPSEIDYDVSYELVFHVEPYWIDRGLQSDGVISEIVLRFKMPDASGEYHMPVILSPFSYSTWKSG
jgi:5-hydroxyisourate hydrolase